MLSLKKCFSKIQVWPLLFNFKKNNGLPLLFILLIFLPMADMVFRISQPLPIKEKRKMAVKPQLQLSRPWDFKIKYEDYFNDNFGFRTHLLYYHNLFTVKYFNTSPTNKVLLGRRGWLFMAKETENRNVVDYFRALKPFTAAELREWRQLLMQRWSWLRKRGIAYLFVIVPNKSTIYPECMPAGIRRLHRQSRMDQLLEALQEEGAFPTIDLRETLLAAKRSQRIYHKTDSHWNELGAYFAYQKIMEKLAMDFPDLKVAALNEFSIESRDRMGGDLAVMLGLQKNYFREQIISLKPLAPAPARTVRERKKLAGFVRESISECPSGTLPTTLMVHDSFIHQLRPLLNPHFKRIIYVWDARLNFYPDIVRRENPKIVIEEITERKLEDLQLQNPDFSGAAAAPER